MAASTKLYCGMNWNVFLNLVLAAVQGTADSIWANTILVAFLSELTASPSHPDGSNTKVGLAAALQGASQLLTALPAGYLADRYSRSKIVAVGGFCCLLSCAILIYATLKTADESTGDHDISGSSFTIICAGIALFGFAGGIISGPAQALLADSLPTGMRDSFYMWLFVLYLLGSSVGPALAIGLFTYWQGSYDPSAASSHWPVKDLSKVMLAGLCLEVPCGVLMMLFRDDRALGRESEAITERAGPAAHARASDPASSAGAEPLRQPLLLEAAGEEAASRGAEGEEEGEDEREQAEAEAEWMAEAAQMRGCGGLLTVRSVPYVLFIGDLVISLASGMTIKFFPLFFKNKLSMSAAEVQTIYLVVPLAMALCSRAATAVAKHLGRVQTSVLFRLVGLSCFGGMVALYNLATSQAALWAIVVLYVVRTAFMNSTYPLDEGVLMDYVPKAQRARWKALESVSQFGWCGSALAGGALVDHDNSDYTFTFVLTIGMQFSAVMLYSLLITVVTGKTIEDVKKARKERRKQADEPTANLEEGKESTPPHTTEVHVHYDD